jgi:protein-S-isoprenylcysteine O-methyltransferase Ste14
MNAADAAWIVLTAIWVAGAFTNKPTVRRQSLGWLAVHCLVLAVVLRLLVSKTLQAGPLAWRFVPDAHAFHWAGDGLQIVGLAFAIWARLHIGRNWSGDVTLKRDHALVRSGPYALVRHPIYSGLSLAIFGRALAHGNVAGLLAFVLVLFEWNRKWRVEERFMVEQFGAEYLRYRQEVKALIPYVW